MRPTFVLAVTSSALILWGGAAEATAQDGTPTTVREFFMLLPADYFPLEEWNGKAQTLAAAKRKYLKTLLKVEDNRNGYMEGDGDGAQMGLKMALFKRPGGGYLIGLHLFGEGENRNHFLEYSGAGKWSDVTRKVIPQYSSNNLYEIPRYGTTVQVFAKIFPEPESPELSEKGQKLYDLVWKVGTFTVTK